jgi:hypothetical protein
VRSKFEGAPLLISAGPRMGAAVTGINLIRARGAAALACNARPPPPHSCEHHAGNYHLVSPPVLHHRRRASGRLENHRPGDWQGCPVRFDFAAHLGASWTLCMGLSLISLSPPSPPPTPSDHAALSRRGGGIGVSELAARRARDAAAAPVVTPAAMIA